MELYVGLDVSLKQAAICIVDGSGKIISERMVVSDPDAIAEFVRAKAAGAVRVGLETGPTAARGATRYGFIASRSESCFMRNQSMTARRRPPAVPSNARASSAETPRFDMTMAILTSLPPTSNRRAASS